MALAGIGAKRLQGPGTYAAPGRRRGTNEGRIVVFVGQETQVAGDVLDLGLVEEGLSAGQEVGNSLVAELGFEQARLMVRAIKDGVIAELGAMFETVCSYNFV